MAPTESQAVSLMITGFIGSYLYCLGFTEPFKFVSLCFSPDLGSFQLLFPEAYFLHCTVSSFYDSSDTNVRPFHVVSQIPESRFFFFLFPIFFPPMLFQLDTFKQSILKVIDSFSVISILAY